MPLTSCHVSSAAFTGDIHLALQFLSGLCAPWCLLVAGRVLLSSSTLVSKTLLDPRHFRWWAAVVDLGEAVQGHVGGICSGAMPATTHSSCALSLNITRAWECRFPDAPLYAVGYSM